MRIISRLFRQGKSKWEVIYIEENESVDNKM